LGGLIGLIIVRKAGLGAIMHARRQYQRGLCKPSQARFLSLYFLIFHDFFNSPIQGAFMDLTNSTGSYGAAREHFIGKVFNHLGGSILTFTLIEIMFFKAGIAKAIVAAMTVVPWIAILGIFMLVGWIASRVAHTVESRAMQYAALGAYILFEAIIFVPLLYMANSVAPGAISNAAIITIAATIGLVLVAYMSRKDFSFLGSVLKWGGLVAIGLIICGTIFGFQLGLFFSVAMVGFAGAAILYDASNVIHHYPEDRYVGAALELFASVALMFWYVLRIAISLRN
jgi:FtsH-binding integral membrane protein